MVSPFRAKNSDVVVPFGAASSNAANTSLVHGLLLKVASLPERMQLAVEAGAKRILIPSENKRDVADVPDAILTSIQWQFYDSPTKAAIMAMGMG